MWLMSLQIGRLAVDRWVIAIHITAILNSNSTFSVKIWHTNDQFMNCPVYKLTSSWIVQSTSWPVHEMTESQNRWCLQ